MKYLYALICLVIVAACDGKPATKEQDIKNVTTRTFEMVSVPAMISDPEKRADYLSLHYWDKFDFVDTAYIHLPEVTEQAFTNYLSLLNYSAPDVISSSIKGMLKKAEADSTKFSYFTKLYEKYLYDPNSPARNEEWYISVLEATLASPLTDDAHRIRPAHLLELAKRNRVGEVAADFTYTLADGQRGKMHQLKSDYLLIFFFNPDCEACREITVQLSNSLLIKQMKDTKRLKILALYPDEDLDAWRDNLSHFPSDWTIGYDAALTLKNEEVYDLKAIPCLYLLDKTKKVVLKDASFIQLMDYLSQPNN